MSIAQRPCTVSMPDDLHVCALPWQTRLVGNEAFLEASVENCTRAPLVLEYVRIDPAAGLTATSISSAPQKGQHELQFEDWMENVQARHC